MVVDLSAPITLCTKQGDTWSLVYNKAYEAFLVDRGLNCFFGLYELPEGEIAKKQHDRSVLRFEFNDRVLFLKRHEKAKCAKGGVLEKTSIPWCSEGGKEFAYFYAFRLHGLATATPIAMGENILADGTVQSFFLTEDFAPYVQLEYLLRHTPDVLAGRVHVKKRRDILYATGRYAKSMHQAGFNHQDFNATHTLLHGFESGVAELALFDLQRVDQNPWQKFRWPIKALAEFNYSSRENNVFSDEDRLFLFHAYCDKVGEALSLYEKLQYRWIKAKTKRIAKHTAKRHARNRKRG